MHHHQRGQQVGPLLPLIPAPCSRHLITAGTSTAHALQDTGSKAVLTVPVHAGTEGQVGAQHYGRDQVLE